MDVGGVYKNLNSISVSDTSNFSQKYNIDETITLSEESTKQDSDADNKTKDDKDAIEKLNKLLEKDKTHAEYAEYKKLGSTIIKIVDDKTNKVITEIPQEKVLDVIASILQNAGLLDKKA